MGMPGALSPLKTDIYIYWDKGKIARIGNISVVEAIESDGYETHRRRPNRVLRRLSAMDRRRMVYNSKTAAGQPRRRTNERLRRSWGQHRRRDNRVLRRLSPEDRRRMVLILVRSSVTDDRHKRGS
ncbi:hypothetical protein JHK87_039952 [Glycine soja]|nr:hypothetical protein JHK87_039952 [Glycine soja]